jgi:hypothetical protein
VNIIDAMVDPALFGPWFQGPSWDRWRVFLKAKYALKMTAEELAIFRHHTGRSTPPARPVPLSLNLGGRRIGKSMVAAFEMVFHSAFIDHRPHLAPGEWAVLPVLACDKIQARVIADYVRAFFGQIPMLQKLVTRETTETIELAERRVRIEIRPASFRRLRGITAAGAACDEVSFWLDAESSANPATEILASLKPAMATIPSATISCTSTPYSKSGVVWDIFRRSYGVDDDRTLVWRGTSLEMNSTLDPSIVTEAFAEDPQAAASEWGAEFRSDISALLDRDLLDSVVYADRRQLPPVPGIAYKGFIDPAGGSGADSFALAIAHAEKRRGARHFVLDLCKEWRPPFSPIDVVEEATAILRAYDVWSIVSDRWGGDWLRAPFRARGVQVKLAEQTKSEIYQAFVPLVTSGQVELLDVPRLTGQLAALERRTVRGGRSSVDHPRGGHDDLANVCAGALVLLAHRGVRPPSLRLLGFSPGPSAAAPDTRYIDGAAWFGAHRAQPEAAGGDESREEVKP